MTKIFVRQGAIFLGSLILLAGLDVSLELGQFQGVVFLLYTFYLSLGFFIGNAVLAAIFWKKGRINTAKYILWGASAYSATGFLIAVIPGYWT